MNYLYGDSTTSTLKSNFLEFLRDAIDFSVFVLQADAKIKQGRVQIGVLREESTAETQRLERFITSVSQAVDAGEKGASDSPTAACAGRLSSLIAEAHRASENHIKQTLADAIARIDAEENASRDGCLRALGILLAPHEPPEASTILRVGLLESGYEASVEGKGEPGLVWKLDVGVPENHAWSSPMRIERLVPQLEIRAPQLTGWISKEVKVRPQRIERHVVTQLTDDQTTVHVEIRTEHMSGVGFDFDVNVAKGKVKKATRVGPAEDQSNGPFDLQVEDVPLVIELVTKLRASLAGLDRHPSITATFEEVDFKVLPTFVAFVERLVAMMAPITKEISQRSLTPNELVLRRLLGNDRREEIFVAKVTLREKLAVLPPESRSLFKPLGLDAVEKGKAPSSPSERPAVRSELAPSAPPPAPVVAPSAAPPPPVPKPSAKPPPPAQAGGSGAPPASRTIKPPTAVPPPRNPPGVPPSAKRPALDTPLLDLVEEVSSSLLEAAPESGGSAKQLPKEVNEALFGALKKIMMLSKNGRAGDAYQEYESLFASSSFATYETHDQRQALRSMVFAKAHPSGEDAVLAAHKAALPRIKALVDTSDPEPSDQEMLGVAYVFLGDSKAAGEVFQAALTSEKKKNPDSELIASLTRRVSEL